MYKNDYIVVFRLTAEFLSYISFFDHTLGIWLRFFGFWLRFWNFRNLTKPTQSKFLSLFKFTADHARTRLAESFMLGFLNLKL